MIAEGTPAAPIVFTSWKSVPQPGDWGGINAASGSKLRLSYCEVGYSGRPGGALGAVTIATTDAIVRQCRIHHSSGHGIYIAGASPFPLWSDVLTDNGGAALAVVGGGDVEALHTTLARNGVGLYVPNGSAVLTNTIIANNNIGVQQADIGTITLSYSLFQDNTAPVVGPVTDTNHINGSAAFEADGYHISKASNAIDAGLMAR